MQINKSPFFFPFPFSILIPFLLFHSALYVTKLFFFFIFFCAI